MPQIIVNSAHKESRLELLQRPQAARDSGTRVVLHTRRGKPGHPALRTSLSYVRTTGLDPSGSCRRFSAPVRPGVCPTPFLEKAPPRAPVAGQRDPTVADQLTSEVAGFAVAASRLRVRPELRWLVGT